MFLRVLALAVSAVLMLSGCAVNEESDPFSAFAGDIVLDLSMEIQGKSAEMIFRRTGALGQVEIYSPQSLKGYVMSLSEQGAKIGYDGFEMAVADELVLPLEVCLSVFSQSSEAITDIKVQKTGQDTLTQVSAAGFLYSFCSDGTLLSVKGVYLDRKIFIRVRELSDGKGVK